jgi:iron complex transport system substrate-binding protein
MRFWIVISVAVLLFAASFSVRRLSGMDEPVTGASVIKADASAAPPPPGGYKRIVSLSPGLTETLFAVGAGDRVVGVTRFCQWPPEAAKRPNVGGFLDPNYEAIVALRPDLVVIMPSHKEHRTEFERLGLHYAVVDQTLLSDILASVLTLGKFCGVEENARKIETDLRVRMDAVRVRAEAMSRPTVLLSSGRDLRAKKLDEVYIVGRRTFLGDLLKIAGGENAFPDAVVDYPALSGEAILRLNPDVIVEFANGLKELGLAPEDAVAPWRSLPGLKAAEQGRVAILEGAHLTIPGPRVVETLEALARAIHPEWGTSP